MARPEIDRTFWWISWLAYAELFVRSEETQRKSFDTDSRKQVMSTTLTVNQLNDCSGVQGAEFSIIDNTVRLTFPDTAEQDSLYSS